MSIDTKLNRLWLFFAMLKALVVLVIAALAIWIVLVFAPFGITEVMILLGTIIFLILTVMFYENGRPTNGEAPPKE